MGREVRGLVLQNGGLHLAIAGVELHLIKKLRKLLLYHAFGLFFVKVKAAANLFETVLNALLLHGVVLFQVLLAVLEKHYKVHEVVLARFDDLLQTFHLT